MNIRHNRAWLFRSLLLLLLLLRLWLFLRLRRRRLLLEAFQRHGG